MTRTRHKNAWIWIAITAIALSSVARVQSGYGIARSYANPVIALISAIPGSDTLNSHAFAQKRAEHGDRAGSQVAGTGSFWLGLLPVLFVGLVTPLVLLSASSLRSLGQQRPAPVLSALFQRPPPAQLL